MRRPRRRNHAAPLMVILLLIAIGAGGWWLLRSRPSSPIKTPASRVATAPVEISAAHVDPANEGRLVRVSGKITIEQPARDAQLGIGADALVLLREVEMLQWRENCATAPCDYALEWSAAPIHSTSFAQPQGHENPARLPFASERFAARGAHLGAFAIDLAVLDDAAQAIAFPVHLAQLPPNLRVTFRERDGALYAGADLAHPAAGDIRVSYRIVPLATRSVTAMQHDGRLQSPTLH